jgi:plastocyanin
MLSARSHRQTRSFVAAAAALAAMFLVGGAVAVAATRVVAIAGFAFSPSSLTINVGDRVTWTNSDSVAHTATATSGAFDTGDIAEGQSASVRFTKPGTYAYACTPHPSMTGTIRVRAASGGGAPTDPPTDTVTAVDTADRDAGAWTLPWALLAAVALLTLVFTVPNRRRRSDE